MLELGAIGFAAPLYLTALLVLPVIWWLLRTTPPAPRRIAFPAVRFLFGLRETEETPARTPLWLLLLRMFLVALVVIALARPVINPDRGFTGSGPLMLVVDNGWAAAPHWGARLEMMDDLIARAEREARSVILVPTAPSATGDEIPALRPMPPVEAVERAHALAPSPWPVDRRAALSAIADAEIEGAVNVVWLADGLASPASEELAVQLQRLGSLRMVTDPARNQPLLLRPPTMTGARLTALVRRPAASAERPFWIRASDENGDVVTRHQGHFATDAVSAEIDLPLPAERRNRITRLTVENAPSAGAVVLLDDRWRRRPVGLVSGRALEQAQPLLSDLYYLERALEPFSDIRRGQIGDLIEDELAVLALADVGTLTSPEVDALESWIARGGVLVRFSGPRLSEGSDELVPVRLRRGDRSLGGAMSWEKPATLAPFDEFGPFSNLAIPDDVEVHRQILAEPSVDLIDKTWVRLTDGTPLITADRRGEGWLVLVHTTANSDWSNLALSGLFVDMLRRLTELSDGMTDREPTTTMSPIETLDGFGRLGSAPGTARPIAGADWPEAAATAATPPGFYGGEGLRRALNLSPGIDDFQLLSSPPPGAVHDSYGETSEADTRPWLLTAALVLLLIDLCISLALRGLVARRGAAVAAGLAGLLMLVPPPASAQDFDDPFSPANTAKRASLGIHLGYVLTGIPQVDDISRDGLRGLNAILSRRTSVEPEEPIAVDIETDDLSVYPMLYWPIVGGQKTPSDEAVAGLNTYIRNGGMILFDTRDRAPGGRNDRSVTRQLRQLVRGLDIPPLVPVPEEHVLTRAFYLLSEFPGRWRGGTLWVEEEPKVNDGVSSVIVGGHDWASAWAIDETGRPRFAVVPDGERQREIAFRFGVNLVMYALTGNYKADQVHVPAIMERLGL
ncbi:MAG: DUF4159 domain-containing protein [Alphaproteobacteria bacterium]|nr:DUF4159 domain-containing protein [Alphaproteobacteria bacterium]